MASEYERGVAAGLEAAARRCDEETARAKAYARTERGEERREAFAEATGMAVCADRIRALDPRAIAAEAREREAGPRTLSDAEVEEVAARMSEAGAAMSRRTAGMQGIRPGLVRSGEREAGPAEAPHRVGDEWELPGLHRQTVRAVAGDQVRFDAFGWRTPEQLRNGGWRRVRCADDVRVLDEEDGDPAEEE